jgi:hypothetical protein
MKHRNSHLLAGYWSSIRKGRAVPDQTDIDPRVIKRFLSYSFILNCENPGRPIYRLAGTELCERFGFELRGTSFLAHWDSRSRLSLVSLLRQGLKTLQPVCLASIAATAGNGMVEQETILVPVSCNGGEPIRFFGMIQTISDPAPLRGHPIAFERLVGSEIIQEDEPAGRHRLEPACAPPNLLIHPKAPHLRLVASQEKPAPGRLNQPISR